MIEGSGSRSIPLTNGSGSGSTRPKNMRIRIRIRIHNTGYKYHLFCFSFWKRKSRISQDFYSDQSSERDSQCGARAKTAHGKSSLPKPVLRSGFGLDSQMRNKAGAKFRLASGFCAIFWLFRKTFLLTLLKIFTILRAIPVLPHFQKYATRTHQLVMISRRTGHLFVLLSVLRIPVGFNADPDPSADPDPGFRWPKIGTVYNWKKLLFFRSKIAIYLSLGLHNGRPSYRRRHPIFVGRFCPLRSGSGSSPVKSIRIRIRKTSRFY